MRVSRICKIICLFRDGILFYFFVNDPKCFSRPTLFLSQRSKGQHPGSIPDSKSNQRSVQTKFKYSLIIMQPKQSIKHRNRLSGRRCLNTHSPTYCLVPQAVFQISDQFSINKSAIFEQIGELEEDACVYNHRTRWTPVRLQPWTKTR